MSRGKKIIIIIKSAKAVGRNIYSYINRFIYEGAVRCTSYCPIPLSDREPLSGFHIHRKPGARIIQACVGQNSRVVLQQGERTGVIKRIKMRGIHGYAVNSQLAEERAAARAALQGPAQRGPFADGQVNGAGGRVDKGEFVGNLGKGKREPPAPSTQARRMPF